MISFARSLGALYGSFVAAAGVLFLAMSIGLTVTSYPNLSGAVLLIGAVGILVSLGCLEYARRLITGRRRYRLLSPFMLESQWSQTFTNWICELDVKPSRDSLCTHLARSMQGASRLADVEICSENGHVLVPGFTSFREAKARLLQLTKRLSSVCEEIAGKLACPLIEVSEGDNLASGIDPAPVRSALT